MSFDPWEQARTIPGLTVRVTRLPDLLYGCTDGTCIYLDDRLTETELRCTLTHELVHLASGHADCQPPPEERRVRRHTARLLIPSARLYDVSRWTACIHEAAEELNVTVGVLKDRLDHPTARNHHD
ncbi:ImmA/IrrE family metallo-endopeptidase [Nesterenkonia jeotgali]|uniref:ImmA/IrrE family metallo-endopeptidase n=1 Tax=Nesterenkonia jeotgali TaxID=317018 RepID=UPI0009F8DB6D